MRLILAAMLSLSVSAFAAEEPRAVPDGPAETELAYWTPIAPVVTPLDLTASPDPVSKRLFGVIPNYRADQFKSEYKPLTSAEKFGIARSDSFDWPNYFLLIGYAAQNQVAAGGGFTHNGGMVGFGEFYARAFGDQIIGSYVTEAILPSLFHEDPRFFRLGKGPVWYRALNAATRVIVTKKDNGRDGIAYSEIVGNAGVTALTTLYYNTGRTASQAFERYTMSIGNDVVSNLLTEFWPDIRHHLPFRR